jgi:hypothetical protein
MNLDMLSVTFGAALGAFLSIVSNYILICIREKRNSTRVKNIIDNELGENKDKISQLENKLNINLENNVLIKNMLEAQSTVAKDPFSYTATDYINNKMGELVLTTSTVINIMKMYKYIKNVETLIIETPSRYSDNDAKNYCNKIYDSIMLFNEIFQTEYAIDKSQ